MYIIWHYLFGWDYLHWNNTAGKGISRIRIDRDGKPFYYRYTNLGYIDRIGSNRETFLTCPASKYIKESKDV